jgi:hypothetical protein
MSEYTETVRLELEQKSSDELISILRNRDEEEWNPEAFAVVAELLKARGIPPEEIAALGPEGYDAVESAPTVTIARFFSPAEAHGLRMALEEAGIPAWVVDEGLATSFGVGVGARVQVRVTDEESARQIRDSAPVAPEAGEEE